MTRRKRLLLHAIRPAADDRADDWERFLREAALLNFPPDAEQLAPNIWLLPDDQAYLRLSQLGHQLGIATRILPFSPVSDWQPFSPQR